MLDKYRASGKCPPSFLAMGAIAVIGGIPVGVVYDLVVEYIPLIYLNLLATLGAVAVIAVTGSWLVRTQRCRNPMLAALFGAAIGLTVWAVSFVFAWQFTMWKVGFQISFFDYVPKRAEIGHSIGKGGKGTPITGFFVYAIWAVEGLIFVLGASLPMWKAAKKPYCEGCKKWADNHKFTFEVAAPGKATVKTIEKAKELSDLVPDPSKEETDKQYDTRLVYSVLGCASCAAVDHLNVDYYFTVMENKAPKEKSKRLQASILVGAEELEAIRLYAGPQGGAAPVEGASAETGDQAAADDAKPDQA